MIPDKRCSKCGEEKAATLEFFRRQPSKIAPLRAICRRCDRQQQQAKYTPSETAAKAKARREKFAEQGLRECSKCQSVKAATSEFFSPQAGGRKLHSWCRGCVSAGCKIHNTANPEKQKARDKAYREANLEKVRANNREYHQRRRREDPEWATHERERSKLKNERLKQTNPRAIAQWCATYRARHKDNPEFILRRRRDSVNSRMKRRSVSGKITLQLIRERFVQQGGKCYYCEEYMLTEIGDGAYEIEHLIPIARGGTNHSENIGLACFKCNRAKHARMPWEFMPEKFKHPLPLKLDGYDGAAGIATD